MVGVIMPYGFLNFKSLFPPKSKDKREKNPDIQHKCSQKRAGRSTDPPVGRSDRTLGDKRLNQGEFLRPGEPLYGAFPPEGRRFVGQIFPVDQIHREAAPGVFCPLSGVMGGQAAGQVVGEAGVQGAVRTAEEIDVVHYPAASSAGGI